MAETTDIAMVVKKVAPYGDWVSPIGVNSVTSISRTLSAPRVSSRSGRAFYVESRPIGGNTIVEITKSGLKDVLPEQFSVQNTVYEYGGSLYDVLPDDRVIFSNKDSTVCLLNPDPQEVTLLISNPVLRYCGFSANSSSPWVLAIEEDHTKDTPSEIKNYVSAINTEAGEVKRVVTHADFYYSTQFSFDGTRLSWLEWDHPDLLFDAAKLYSADWSPDGAIYNVRLISGDQRESVTEPRWGPDGSLFFCQELGEYRRIFRIRPGKNAPEEIRLDGLDEAEFGEVRLFEGSRTYAPLSEKTLIASACTNGTCTLISINLETGSWLQLVDADTLCHLNFDAMSRLDDYSVLVVGSGIEALPRLYKVDVRKSKQVEVVRESTEQSFPPSFYSQPEHIHITAKGSPSRGIHGFLWLPRNPNFTAPEGELPPLVIYAHGGPTGYNGCGLTLRTQYFTSRGYAYCFINYTGSNGHGRSYRQSLFGSWGIVDADDSAEFANHFVESGRVRPGGVAITGPSAGGYNTLQTVVRHPKAFVSGFCVCGISDLKRFDGKTHKLESDYTPALVLPKGTSIEDKDKVYQERSALFHHELIQSPLTLMHGKADTIVPIEQARLMAKALEKQGNVVELIEVEGEGHMFGMPSSQKTWLEEEEKWWRRTLL